MAHAIRGRVVPEGEVTPLQPYDDAVVGAGVTGMAHAWHLARRGRRVAVFERAPRAQGASVRNFGMIWPIGQPAGPRRDLALRSRTLWQEVVGAAGVWHEARGSLHLAYHDDEWQVLREFADGFAQALSIDLLDAAAVRRLCPRVQEHGLRGGLYSDSEMCVDARRTVHDLADWLRRQHVDVYFDYLVRAYERPRLVANGQSFEADRLWVCTGDDLQTLYPQALLPLGLVRCKLQMLRSQCYAERLGPMLAAGLTLRHYDSFAQCPTLAAVKARVAAAQPEFDRWGIHVMVSQNSVGELVLGDSHEYGDAIDLFHKMEIDRLILDYLGGYLDMPDLTIAARWQGIYIKAKDQPYVMVRPADGVVAVTGVGGAGMTLSFGLAERVINETLGSVT